jgi:Competence protein CoiA-like family
MFWAFDNADSTNLIQASPKGRGICPVCKGDVYAKCGSIICWHWAHNDSMKWKDCDRWSESEGPWHLRWKLCVPQNMRECVIRRQVIGTETEIVHRADILNSRETVIELQHSPISEGEVRDRENFYINMIWIFDMAEVSETTRGRVSNLPGTERMLRIDKKIARFSFRANRECHEFRWRHPSRSLFACRSPMFFDFGKKDELFQVKTLNRATPCYGTGNFISKRVFKQIYFV